MRTYAVTTILAILHHGVFGDVTTTTEMETNITAPTPRFPTPPIYKDAAFHGITLDMTDHSFASSENAETLISQIFYKTQPYPSFHEISNFTSAKMTFRVHFNAWTIYAKEMGPSVENNLKAFITSSSVSSNHEDDLQKFSERLGDICSAEHACDRGYNCTEEYGEPVCSSLCEDVVCHNGGMCEITMTTNGTLTTVCSCIGDEFYDYEGPSCAKKVMTRSRQTTIMCIVFGTAMLCLLLCLAWVFWQNMKAAKPKPKDEAKAQLV